MTLPGLPGGEPLEPFRLEDLVHLADGRPLELARWQLDIAHPLASPADVHRSILHGKPITVEASIVADVGEEAFAQLGRWAAELDARPPVPARIRASHAVPYGDVYRQWNTRGELELWANRGELEDLPRVEAPHPGIDVRVSAIAPPGFGVPIVNEPRTA